MQSRWNLRNQLSKRCLRLHGHPLVNVDKFGERKGVETCPDNVRLCIRSLVDIWSSPDSNPRCLGMRHHEARIGPVLIQPLAVIVDSG
jgi:hypothetical protein